MEEPFEINEISGVLHRPDAPNGEALALTHGASSNHTAPVLLKMAQAFLPAPDTWCSATIFPFAACAPVDRPIPPPPREDRLGVAAAISALPRPGLRPRLCRRTFVWRPPDRHGRRRISRPRRPAGAVFLSPASRPAVGSRCARRTFPTSTRRPSSFTARAIRFGTPEELREAIMR